MRDYKNSAILTHGEYSIMSIKLCTAIAAIFILAACSEGSAAASTPYSAQVTATANEPIQYLQNNGRSKKLEGAMDIKGVDVKSNGIREDVDAYIEAMEVTLIQKKSIRQFARSIQTTLIVDTQNKESLQNANVNISRAVQCISLNFPDIKKRAAITNAIERITVNTKERASQYTKFNTAVSGLVSKLQSGDTCNE